MTGRTARRRLSVEERRARLVDVGLRLFGDRAADEVAVDDIAREAGVSSGLLYHYFGSKKEFQAAVTAHAYEQLRAATEPDPDLPPGVQLHESLTAYVEFVRANARWWAWLLRGGAGGDPRLEQLSTQMRETTAQRIFSRLPAGEHTPAVDLAVRGWVGFNAEVTVSWVERRQGGQVDLTSEQVADLMIDGLLAVLGAAGLPEPFLESVRRELPDRPRGGRDGTPDG